MRRSRFSLAALVGTIGLIALHAAADASGRPYQQAQAILAHCDKYEILSLDPNKDWQNFHKHLRDPSRFHGWKILGHTVVQDPRQLDSIRKAIARDVTAGRDGALCFAPRHGVRARAFGESADFLICFECSWLTVIVNSGLVIKEDTLPIADTAQVPLNGILNTARIPLAK